MMVALFGLIIVTGGAVAGLIWSVVMGSGSTDSLSTIAAVGIGAIAGFIGGSSSKPKGPNGTGREV